MIYTVQAIQNLCAKFLVEHPDFDTSLAKKVTERIKVKISKGGLLDMETMEAAYREIAK